MGCALVEYDSENVEMFEADFVRWAPSGISALNSPKSWYDIACSLISNALMI